MVLRGADVDRERLLGEMAQQRRRHPDPTDLLTPLIRLARQLL
jgi:hypothetical protein